MRSCSSVGLSVRLSRGRSRVRTPPSPPVPVTAQQEATNRGFDCHSVPIRLSLRAFRVEVPSVSFAEMAEGSASFPPIPMFPSTSQRASAYEDIDDSSRNRFASGRHPPRALPKSLKFRGIAASGTSATTPSPRSGTAPRRSTDTGTPTGTSGGTSRRAARRSRTHSSMSRDGSAGTGDAGIGPVTVNTYWRQLRPFFNDLERRDGVENPFRRMKAPSQPSRHREGVQACGLSKDPGSRRELPVADVLPAHARGRRDRDDPLCGTSPGRVAEAHVRRRLASTTARSGSSVARGEAVGRTGPRTSPRSSGGSSRSTSGSRPEAEHRRAGLLLLRADRPGDLPGHVAADSQGRPASVRDCLLPSRTPPLVRDHAAPLRRAAARCPRAGRTYEHYYDGGVPASVGRRQA